MNISFKATNTKLTSSLRKYAEDKMKMLSKYLPKVREIAIEIEVNKKHKSGNIYRAEVMIYIPKEVIRAEEWADDMYAAIDLVVPKLKVQAKKHRGKIRDKRQKRDKEGVLRTLANLWSSNAPTVAAVPRIVKRKRFSLTKPISETEAVEQMNLIGHSFYLFNNAQTGRFGVIYKRDDGDYGLIEPKEEGE